MSPISTDELREEIAEILKDADLASMSAKKVRLQLESKLDVELSARKKEIDQLVMDYVNSKEDSEDEDDDMPPEEEESDDDQPIKKEKEPPVKKEKSQPPAKKRKASSEEEEEKPKKATPKKKAGKKRKKGSGSDSDSDWGKKEKAKKGRGNGYTRAYKLSPALAELMGEESMPRHEVVKRVWAIIKERNLYDENNKQFAICDDALYKVFGCKRFRTFGMMKYLKTHFHD